MYFEEFWKIMRKICEQLRQFDLHLLCKVVIFMG